MTLNEMCCSIKGGSGRYFKKFIEDKRIKPIIVNACSKVCSHNGDMNYDEVWCIAQTAIWEEICTNYTEPKIVEKGDNWVIRFVYSRLYPLLLNEIRDLKQLRWDYRTSRLENKYFYERVSSDKEGEEVDVVSTLENEASIHDELNALFEEHDIDKVVTRLFVRGELTPNEGFIFSMRFSLDKTIKEITEAYNNQFGGSISEPWISEKLKQAVNKVAQEYTVSLK